MFKLMLMGFAIIGAVNLSDVTYYEILGVSKQASALEIRQAYKKLAVKFHPDKNPGSSEQEKFLKITEAYETLKDTEKRHKYDLYGSQSSYSRKYDYKSQAEYDNLYYNGLYHGDPYVDTLSGANFYSYLKEGFYFINFYSPFCPPCQNIADDWKNLAEIYKGIVKVGAVNCKYHNSFCYNSMRISSYPSLLFYPNGKNGNFIYYHGERTLQALEEFVMRYLRNQVYVPTVVQLRSADTPIAYVLGKNRIEENALTRIAYQLKGLVTLVIVEDDGIREKLSTDDSTIIVFRYKTTTEEIQTTEEKEVIRQILEVLPQIDLITPDKLKVIRNNLRRGLATPWVLFFSTKGDDRLELHQMRIAFPNMHFGEIECDRWAELCASLHVESTPAWGMLKRGGVYQAAPAAAAAAHSHAPAPRHFIRTAARATRLHTLSPTELSRILNGGDLNHVWVLLVVPYQLSWDHIGDPFTRASLHFLDSDDISFGIIACTMKSDALCRRVASNQPVVLVQNGTRRYAYAGQLEDLPLTEFVHLLRDSTDLELTEQQALEILDASARDHTWLVAYLPSNNDDLAYQWMILAKKLRPLEFVRVGVLNCARAPAGFCTNVRSPTARLYPYASGHHYSVNLRQLSEAPYMLEWALERIDESVQKLSWQTFARTVIAEELNPNSDVKPWLVYFHSPRCYRCHEMYADFAIAGILLDNMVKLGKVNCIAERSLCQHEQITSYPSLKLYLNRNQHQRFSNVISLQVTDYMSLLQEIRSHLIKYNDNSNILAGVENFGAREGIHIKHDEF